MTFRSEINTNENATRVIRAFHVARRADRLCFPAVAFFEEGRWYVQGGNSIFAVRDSLDHGSVDGYAFDLINPDTQ